MSWIFDQNRERDDEFEEFLVDEENVDRDLYESSEVIKCRRECIRIHLPAADTLEIVKSKPDYIHEQFRLLEIVSEKAVGLVRIGHYGDNLSISLGQKLTATIMFHDRKYFEITGELIRYCCDMRTGNQKLVCVLDTRIPKEIIDRELEYLKDNYNYEPEDFTGRFEAYMKAEVVGY